MEYYTVPKKYGAQIALQTEVRDKLSSLDVVWGNMYEGEEIDPQLASEVETEFYRGAPPQWLNFYWAERNKTPFVKREIYTQIRELIQKKINRNWSISTINLFHQPGSGGTTLAKQVLWDLRKELRCAQVIDSISDPTAIAQQVIHLFNAGDSRNQNTVLLLVDNKQKDTNEDTQFNTALHENLIQNIKQSNISADIPVVIIFNCFWQKNKTGKKNLMLCTSLTEKEQKSFHYKHTEVVHRHKGFHGFNIMQSNFSQTEACEYLKPIRTKKRPRSAQILSFLAVINSYVPGSYLTETLCLDFMDKKNHISGRPTLEKQMRTFADLLVVYSTHAEESKYKKRCLRMAHPMIADNCLRLLTDAGVTLSDTTRKLFSHLCPQTVPPYLVKIIKQLLTKRETYLNNKGKERLHKFSKLILDIMEKENKSVCVRLFKDAAKKLAQDPFIPQALARFYYIELNDYARAEYWAKTVIQMEPNNSFIRDTLGQVYKNKLKNLKLRQPQPREILQIGKLAFEAFEEEAKTAEKELEPEMQGDGVGNISASFNYRGLFGYIQVANTVFFKLTKVNPEWSKVLRQETKSPSFINSEMCGKYQSLLTSIKQRVEEKCNFFETFLMYSKPKMDKNDPLYIWTDIDECYVKYIKEEEQTALQILRERRVGIFAGLLSVLSHITSVSDLEQITEQWREIYMNSQSDNDAQNYILANIILSQKSANSEILRPVPELQDTLQKLWKRQKKNRRPEFYLLVLLLFWSDEFNPNTPDLQQCVQYMRESYERTYQKHLRSRYLVPLFFLGNGGGLQRLVHTYQLHESYPDLDERRKQIEVSNLFTEEHENTEIEGLQRIEGVIRNHKVFALRGRNQIEVSSHSPASVYNKNLVSFYLGFTIRGPVAYNIR